MSEEMPDKLSTTRKGRSLDALERDVDHLRDDLNEDRRDRRAWQDHIEKQIDNLGRTLGHRLEDVVNRMQERNRTPWQTIFAGVSVLVVVALAVGTAALSPLKLQTGITKERVDLLIDRELHDAFTRGVVQQRFSTVENSINAAINNRKDIDAKHTAAQQALGERIDEVAHELDNGLGQRIKELMAPMGERLLALEREVFSDATRDIDRK